jgi:hypothetical protein
MTFSPDGRRFWLTAALLLSTTHLAALPDLVPSEIGFSKENPEPTEQITLSVTVRNTGDAYHDQVVSTPIAFKDDSNIEGGANDGTTVHSNGTTGSPPTPSWQAQGYYAATTVQIGKLSFFLSDMGEDDDIRLQVRRGLAISTPIPSPSASDVLAEVTLNSTAATTNSATKSNYIWQDFVATHSVTLAGGATYWFCLSNFNTVSSSNGYTVWRDTCTVGECSGMQNQVAFSFNGGTSWRDSVDNNSGKRKIYHRVYSPQETVVRFYQGDPAQGGALIGVSTVAVPIGAGGSAVVSTTWTAPAAGAYDIYVEVDSGTAAGLIAESSESNNKVFRTVNVVQVAPAIASASPAHGAAGIGVSDTRTFVFNKEMNAGTLAGAFTLTAVQNDSAQTVSEAVGGVLTYDAVSRAAAFAPSAPLKNNYRYEARWTASALDTLGFALTPRTITFLTAVNSAARNVITGSDLQTKVSLQPGVVPEATYFVDIDVAPSVVSAVRAANEKATRDRDAFTAPVSGSLRRVRLFTGTAPGTEAGDRTFSGNVRLSIPYADDGQGYVAGTSPRVKEENQAIHWLNEEDGLWVRLPESEVDAAANTVSAPVPHFSYFVLMGLSPADLSQSYAYPVPFRPNAGLGHRRVKFTNLSPQCVIKIYTLSGDLVRTIEESDGDGFNDDWDASDVASGAYLYVIENDSQRRTGQLVIIK